MNFKWFNRGRSVVIVALFVILLSLSHNQLYAQAESNPTLKTTQKILYIDYHTYTIKMNNLAKNATVTYKSSNKKIACVTTKGKVTPMAVGTAKITVNIKQNGKTYKNYLNVTVKKPYIEISKITDPIVARKSVQFTANAYGTDDKIYWEVSDVERADIDSETGKFVGDAAGTVEVIATTESLINSVKVTIVKEKVEISGDSDLIAGQDEVYTIAGRTNKEIQWSISDNTLLNSFYTDSDELNARALRPGTVTITVESASGYGEKTIKINPIEIAGDSYITLGETKLLTTNFGQGIDWSVDDSSIVELSRDYNQYDSICATGLKEGTTTLYAQYGYSKASMTITIGQVQDFTLSGDTSLNVNEAGNYRIDYPGDPLVTWSVSDNSYASLSQNGDRASLTTLKKGSFILTAAIGSRKKSLLITVAGDSNPEVITGNTSTAKNTDTSGTTVTTGTSGTTDNSGTTVATGTSGSTDTTSTSDTSANHASYKTVTKNGIQYELRNTYAYVAGAEAGTTTANIPSEVEGLPVTIIGKNFGQCSTLKSVTWEGDIVTLEPNCFSNNHSLTNVSLHGGEIVIGNSAFEECNSLSDLKFSGNVRSVGGSAFSNCTSLTQLTIPGTETTYYEDGLQGPFYKCSSLTSLRLESKVLFSDRDALMYLFLGITDSDNKSVLKELYINIDQITSDILFCYLTNLRKLTLVGTQSICSNTTRNLSKLEEIVLPDTLTSIPRDAFENTPELRKINIPASVMSIGNGAFMLCKNLTTIDAEKNENRTVDVERSFLYTRFESIQGCYLNGAENLLSSEEYASLQTALTVVNTLKAADADDYAVIKGCHDWIVSNTAYDDENYNNHTIPAVSYTVDGVYFYHIAVCGGYANAFQCLMDLAGIECYTIDGEIIGVGMHAWNIVKLDGAYYQIDCTWDDPAPDTGKIYYDYFLLRDKEIKKSHSWDSGKGYPNCPNNYTADDIALGQYY